jgi:hypothetical protein
MVMVKMKARVMVILTENQVKKLVDWLLIERNDRKIALDNKNKSIKNPRTTI